MRWPSNVDVLRCGHGACGMHWNLTDAERLNSPARNTVNQCKLTECQGKPRCRHCMAMDMRYRTPEEAVREALEQEVSELRVLLKRLLDSREKEARTSMSL